MEIKGKVHCLFEQSGTFKKEFIKLGIPAEDYDIQNEFGETDHIVDLFAEIEKGFDGKPSVFDNITEDDLIVAFFPCIYFSCLSQMAMYWNCVNYRKLSIHERTKKILERSRNREHYFGLAVKMLSVAQERGLRLIMENPWSEQTFLKSNFVMAPSLIDNDRSLRGDFRKKPTAYWFINCEPTNGKTIQKNNNILKHMTMKHTNVAGMCSMERSMISPDYARNFICDFVLGKYQDLTEQQLTLEM